MRCGLFVILGLLASATACEGQLAAEDATAPSPPPSGQPNVPAPGSDPPSACLATAKTASPAALLTRAQYDNTVEDLLGDVTRPAQNFPPENQVQGFNNNALAHQVSPLLVEEYLEAAETLSSRAVMNRLGTIAPCPVGEDTNLCGRSFVRSFGLRAFRRPLSSTEAQLFDDLFARTASRSGYSAGIELVLQAMLQSPQFLYRVDSLRSPSPESGAVLLGPFELAARLSFFLAGSTPDAELLRAAEQKQLATDLEVDAQARRLLALPRARQVVRDFHRQWLGAEGLSAVARQAEDVSLNSSVLGDEWLKSLDSFVDHVFWERGTVSEFFASKRVYLSATLAPLYGVAPQGTDLSPVELSERAGLLTQPALLALLAHPNQSAPVIRGAFVRERLLCQPVPPPPPTVVAQVPDPSPTATTRERLRQHTADPSCSACHALLDGIGFGFEAFDQFGRFRTSEHGLAIDATGEVRSSGDAGLDGPFDGLVNLSARLGDSPMVRDCVATNWYRFALGRVETDDDKCSLDVVKSRFQARSGDLRELLIAITQSVAFRYRPALAKEGP